MTSPIAPNATFPHSLTALAAAAHEEGILYLHLPTLGTPRPLRKAFRAKEIDPAEFRARFLSYLRTIPAELSALEALVRLRPSALMCFEGDPAECHRGMLTAELVERGLTLVEL